MTAQFQPVAQPAPQPEGQDEKPSLLMPILIGVLVTVSVLLIGFVLIWVLGFGYIFTGEQPAKSTNSGNTQEVEKVELVYEGGTDEGERKTTTIDNSKVTTVESDGGTATAPNVSSAGAGTVDITDFAPKPKTNQDNSKTDQGGSGQQQGGGSGGSQGQPSKTNSGYVFPDSNKRLLSYEEINSHNNWQLYIGRNEIYARHGRGFKRKDLQDYFNSCTWYSYKYDPDSFNDDLLNDVEKKNAVAILEVEKARGSEYL